MIPGRVTPPATGPASGRPAAHLRLIGGTESVAGRGAAAPRPVASGALVALPILATPDGRPFDLLAATEGHATALLFVPGGAQAAAPVLAILRKRFAARAAAARGTAFLIAPDAEAAPDAGFLLVDRDGGFAYSLGLAAWDHDRGRADLDRAVGLVVDAVGQVVAVEAGDRPDIDRLMDRLADAAASAPRGIAHG